MRLQLPLGRVLALALALALAPSTARASEQTDAVTGAPTEDAEDSEDSEDSEDKGFAIMAAPIASYDTTLKTGIGAFGQLVVSDPTGVQPFRISIAAQAFATFARFQDHYVRWDLPGLAGTKLRWDAQVRYQAWAYAPYFGEGNDTELRDEDDVGEEFYTWDSHRAMVRTNLRRPLGESPWDIYGSAVVADQQVEYEEDSFLARDAPTGLAGGLLNQLGIGFFRDTRTDEIDPYDGSAIDLQFRGSHPWAGSDFQFSGIHASWRGWARPIPRIVLASRLLVDARRGDEPFFTQAWLGGLTRGVVGGRFFLRGLSEERLRGDGVAGAQGELRWTFWTPTIFKTMDLRWMLVPFVDTARIWRWTEGSDATLDPHMTGGAGLRCNIKQLLIVRADVGYAVDRYRDGSTRRDQVQFYFLSEHPF
jgi:hypothetical protein